jgi:flagellar FliJ protein
MKFRFPLQKVMQHRKTVEELAQRDFEEANAILIQENQKLEEMQNQILQARERAFQSQTEGGRAGPVLSQVHDFMGGQDIRIERQKEKIKECQSLVENLREILRQKAIEYKMIESLKERKLEKFKVEARKKEQKQMDDTSLMRFRREEIKK